MSDEVDRERNRRLFGGFLGWLMYDGRRPGMLGAAVSFTGRTRRGKAALRRTGSHWEMTEAGTAREVTTADVLTMVGAGDFFLLTADVVPDLAELLFKEAVQQAEASHGHVVEAARHSSELADDLRQNPVPWILTASELDRATRTSISSMVLAIAAAEAQVNRWAELSGGWHDDEDRRPVTKKCQILAGRAGHDVSLDRAPYQQLCVALRRRDALLHSKPRPETLPVTVPEHRCQDGQRALTRGRHVSPCASASWIWHTRSLSTHRATSPTARQGTPRTTRPGVLRPSEPGCGKIPTSLRWA
jgi:hypothetical protein